MPKNNTNYYDDKINTGTPMKFCTIRNTPAQQDNECKKKTNRVHHRSSASYNPEISLSLYNLTAMCERCESEIHGFKKNALKLNNNW